MKGALTDLLDQTVRRCPERPAVEEPARGAVVTYEELGARTSAMCEALIQHGVHTADRVGLYAGKSIASVVAIHGILAAGAAYVPVDTAAPPQRSAGILEDAQPRLLVAEETLLERISEESEHGLSAIASVDDGLVLVAAGKHATPSGPPSANPGGGASDDAALAYVLYTSGSTGKPKGVMHTHSSAMSFIDWCSTAFEPTPVDRFSSHAPFHFDLSILDLFLSVKHGAAVVLIDDQTSKQPLALASLIATRRISIWYSTPSTLRLLAEFGKLDRLDFASLRLVLFAGEVFPLRHLRALHERWPTARYFNLYGPTETNVCTYFEVDGKLLLEGTEAPPIGRPCSGDRTRVVDSVGRDVEAGTEGELIVTGGSVMTGYLGSPALTAAAFIEDSDGTKWYRTGDVVREAPDEGYLFRGRKDRMVKRRGYRVELGEVEAALSSHPAILEAAVCGTHDGEGGVRLDGFVVFFKDDSLSIIELKQFCAKKLPGYMVPDRFLIRATLPRTSTGKTDYMQLGELAS